MEKFRQAILEGIPNNLPNKKPYNYSANHAPKRIDILSVTEKKLALKNALRYFSENLHSELAKEFIEELNGDGKYLMAQLNLMKIRTTPAEQYMKMRRDANRILNESM